MVSIQATEKNAEPQKQGCQAATGEPRPAKPILPGQVPIPPGQLWPLEFLHSELGYGARARAATIKAGLPVYVWQKRSWFLTDDLIALIRREGVKKS
jgi:hypothetical protein